MKQKSNNMDNSNHKTCTKFEVRDKLFHAGKITSEQVNKNTNDNWNTLSSGCA